MSLFNFRRDCQPAPTPTPEPPQSSLLVRVTGAPVQLSDLELPTEVVAAVKRFVAILHNQAAVATALGHLSHLVDRTVLNLWGPPGVGKTQTARAVAAAVGKPLWRLDTASIRDKHVGVAEQRLKEAFAQMRANGDVLLIDEADTLVARRSAGTSGGEMAHNTLVNQLIHELNEHKGVVVLASNLRKSYDDAIARRVTDVHLPAPDSATRQRLWRRKLAVPGFNGSVDDSWLRRIDEQVRLAKLGELRPFTAADIESVIFQALAQVAASRPLGSELFIACGDIDRALADYLRCRQHQAEQSDPCRDLEAAKGVVAANLDMDRVWHDTLAGIVGQLEGIDGASPGAAQAALARLKRVELAQLQTLETQMAQRIGWMQVAGMPQTVNAATAQEYAELMRGSVADRARGQAQ